MTANRAFFVILFFLFAPGWSATGSRETLVLGASRDPVALGEFSEFIRDPNGALGPAEVAALSDSNRVMAQPGTGDPNFGYTQEAIWMRFDVVVPPSNQDVWYLEVSHPHLDFLDLYLPDGRGGWSVRRTGMMRPSSNREVAWCHFVFRIASHEAKPGTWMFRAKSEDNVLLPVTLSRETRFWQGAVRAAYGYAAYFGMIAALFLFNLFLAFALREKTFLVYSLFLGWFGLWMTSAVGFFNVYAAPLLDAFPILNRHMHLGIAVTIVLASEFSLRMLSLKEHFHRLWKGLRLVQIATGLVFFTCLFLAYGVQIELQLALLGLDILLIFTAAVHCVAKGDRSARYFLLAWLSLLVSGLVYMGCLFDVVPSNFWTIHSINLGSLAEMLLLSFALADRYNRMKDDKLSAEREALRVKHDLERAAEDKLYRDDSTGLANRLRLMRDLSAQESGTLFILNIDHFRELNRFYGREAGDALLVLVAQALAAWAGAEGLRLYKLRGDEFGLLGTPPRTVDEALALGERLLTFFEDRSFPFREHQIPVEVTVGVCTGREALPERADAALRMARQRRKDILVWQADMEERKESAVNLAWVRSIREAVHEHRVHAFFQPIHNLRSGRIEKFELLMRLRDREGKVIPPDQFLPAAKYSRLYGDLSRIVIRKAAECAESHPFEFSVNLSAEDIRDERTVARVMEVLAGCAHPERMVFEILESEGIDRYQEMRTFLDAVKAKGCKVAIDDFGTGYSNFNHVLRLDVDYLKIDGSLVRNLGSDRHSQVLVENIVDFCDKLGIQTIAEYVHSAEVLAEVTRLGVHFAQGYHIGAPSPEIRVAGAP